MKLCLLFNKSHYILNNTNNIFLWLGLILILNIKKMETKEEFLENYIKKNFKAKEIKDIKVKLKHISKEIKDLMNFSENELRNLSFDESLLKTIHETIIEVNIEL